MNLSNTQLNNAFKSKRVIKIIAGINNINISEVATIASAAQLAGANYLDIAANVSLVKFLKSFSSLPLCISSIDPIEIYNCVSCGVNLVEVGNYDVFYQNNIYITSTQLLDLIKEIKLLIGNYDMCVTIPYHMNLYEQIDLSKRLEYLGVNILQTEGLTLNQVSTKRSFSSHLSTSLLSTYAISQSVDIPIITSSGITSMFTNMPFYYGASGLGLSSAIKRRNGLMDMVNYINEIKYSMLNNLSVDSEQVYQLNKYNNFLQINNNDILDI